MLAKRNNFFRWYSGGIQVGFRWYSGGIGKTKQLLPKPYGGIQVVSGGLEVCFRRGTWWPARPIEELLANIIAKMDVGRDPARDHLAETIMVEAVAWSVKHSKSQKLLL